MFNKKKKSTFLLEIEYLAESSRAKADQENEQFLTKIREDIRKTASLGRHEIILQFKDAREAADQISGVLRTEGFTTKIKYSIVDLKITYLTIKWG